ncbi:hypothetical protein HYT55_03665 [Candidatus Woesearchaeota archaeon]|nr:hypothetical protein [Candidatus Woesearchaeota archaeon]
MFGIYGILVYDFGDEMLHASPREIAVEKKVGREIFMNWTDEQEQRDQKATLVEKLYDGVQLCWDHFTKQWQQVAFIEVDDLGEAINATMNSSVFYPNTLRLNSRPLFLQEGTLVHELAHAWYGSLSWKEQDHFRKRWLDVSNKAYHHCGPYEETDTCRNPFKSCKDYVREAATTSCYGASSFEEDVAEVVRTVFSLNRYPQTFQLYLQNIDPLSYRRVVAKIQLAGEFNFFSKREEETATTLIRTHFARR